MSSLKIESILDDELLREIPLIEVFVDRVKELKDISKVVQTLNNLFPIPALTHLKRVRSGGEVLLFPAKKYSEIAAENVHEVLKLKGFDLNLLQNNVERVEVAAFPPIVKQQYLKCHSKWPCNFHANKYLEKLYTNTLFNEKEVARIEALMKLTEELMNNCVSSPEAQTQRNATLVFDSKSNAIIATGVDKSHEGPCKHSVMIAIDNVAKTQNGGAWKNEDIEGDALKLLCGNEFQFGAPTKNTDEEGPYLCTGYDIFTYREPCIMCAMALVHSRCKRLFYRKRSRSRGGLGSLCKIHTVKDLNHHYEVFIVE